MGEILITTLSMDKYHPSTQLSMDSGSFNELEREMNRNTSVILSRPLDINLPLASEISPPSFTWNGPCDILDVDLGRCIYKSETIANVSKIAKKCSKRLDSVWGAWFFFSSYFKPVLNDKSKSRIIRDRNGLSGYDKSDLQLDTFLVQHDMENLYMWIFKGKPENALGKMQLRSYMNGHSRQGEQPFPFSVDKGFVRSHKMQRKHYRGLSNPQCVHGIEIVLSPNFSNLDEDEKRRWTELTGRDINISIPPEASDYSLWRNLPSVEFEVERSLPKKTATRTCLNLSTQPFENNGGLLMCNKRKKDSAFLENSDDSCNNILFSKKVGDLKTNQVAGLPWLNEFSGVMKNTYGPVTASKAIYEDDDGFLVLISLPFADLEKVKVTWRNTTSHGILKISCVSTTGVPFIKKHNRTFKLTDPTPEHCPPGEFVREIPLPNRIPEDAQLEAYRDETGTMLEILVPKHRAGPEEHEVRVCLRPLPWIE